MQSFWKNRKVLVTGAGGFIGSHLCELLIDEGAEVTAMLHYDCRPSRSNLDFLVSEKLSKIKFISGDICDPFFVRTNTRGMDTVFHLAALIAIPYSYVAPQTYFRTNVEGTLNIVEACRSENIRRLVHTSTSETYGTAIYTPIDEKHPLQGQSPYSASKIGADKVVESYHLSFNLPAVTLRPFNTYGPRQSARAIIPTIITQLFSESSEIKLGELSPVRDLNFVKDTVAAFLAAAQFDNCIGKTLNAGSGRSITIGELATLLMKLTGREKPIVTDKDRLRPEKSEVFKLIADSSQLQELTGWKPRYILEDGLRHTIDFVHSNPRNFQIGEYSL